MVVLPIVLALTAVQCDASLQPVTAALQQNATARASSLLAAVPAECSQSAEFYALTGVTDELSGRAAAAESAFRKAVSLDPKAARYREQLGAAYLRNKKPAEAAAVLQEAVALDPNNSKLKTYLIGAYVETGAWEKASSLFDQVGGVSAARGDPILLLWFVQTLLETGQSDRLKRELPPDAAGMTPPLLFSLGTLFGQHGLYEKAITYLQKIPESAADDAVYFNLGLAYSHLHDFEEARRCYFLAIDEHPRHVDAYFRVGLDYAAAGDGRMALPWLFRAHQWAPDRADISYGLVEQLIQSSYFETAQEVLTSSGLVHPASELLMVAEADLKKAKGDNDGAAAAYRAVLTRQPNFPPALTGLARAEITEGKEQEARSNLLAVISRNADDPAANGELGSLEAHQKEWSAAEKHLGKAWAQDRSNTNVALELARTYLHLNQPSEALKILAGIRAAMQQSPAFHIELAQVYSQLHQTLEAEAERKAVTQLEADAQQGLRFDEPKVYVH
jgi:tetratricopeptide (TPR) repeat protein